MSRQKQILEALPSFIHSISDDESSEEEFVDKKKDFNAYLDDVLFGGPPKLHRWMPRPNVRTIGIEMPMMVEKDISSSWKNIQARIPELTVRMLSVFSPWDVQVCFSCACTNTTFFSVYSKPAIAIDHSVFHISVSELRQLEESDKLIQFLTKTKATTMLVTGCLHESHAKFLEYTFQRFT